MQRLDKTDARLAMLETGVDVVTGEVREVRAMIELVAAQVGVR